MADENEEVAETVVEEVEQKELPLDAKEEPKEEVKAEAKEEKVEEPKPDWRDKELKKKHAQNMELKRIQAEKDAEISALKAIAERVGQQQTQQPKPIQEPEIEARVTQRLAQQKYNEDCNKAAQVGSERYKTDWQQSISTLETLGGFDPDTMTGLLATDDPAKVLYELGKNPDQYHRIMELPTPRRIIEMGKLAMQPAPAKKVSDAPAPVSTVGGKAAPAAETLSDKQDDDGWYKIRLAQKRKRFEERNGIRR